MTINKFPSKEQKPPFFEDIEEDGYHIFSRDKAKIPDYYPNQFPDYPGVLLNELQVDDVIKVRVFFRIGSGEEIRADGGYIDLRVEFIDDDKVLAAIVTELPKGFPLATGGSVEIFEDEILSKVDTNGN
jgi:hypothetical protein